MDKKNIQSILKDALETDVPADEIQLWPALKANLVAGQQQGEKMKSNRSRIVYATATIIVLLTLILLTPQGRAFAQDVLQFFTRAEETSFPLAPDQIVLEAPAPNEPTAIPPVPLVSIEEAEEQVGFDAAELPAIPKGFNYLGARVYGNAINIEYEAIGGGSTIILRQSKDGFYQSEWEKKPEDAIQQVKVGDVDGEFVQGTFVVYPEETSATWKPDASILILRWNKDNTWFEITKFGNVEVVEYLGQNEMIALAESLVYLP